MKRDATPQVSMPVTHAEKAALQAWAADEERSVAGQLRRVVLDAIPAKYVVREEQRRA